MTLLVHRDESDSIRPDLQLPIACDHLLGRLVESSARARITVKTLEPLIIVEEHPKSRLRFAYKKLNDKLLTLKPASTRN